MSRLLYLAPIVHPVDGCQRSEELYSKFVKEIIDKLKNKHVDVCFSEGFCEIPSHEEIRCGNDPLLNFFYERGVRFEETENIDDFLLHRILIGTDKIPIIGRLAGRITDVCVKRRDFVMGKNVSEKLQYNEVGFLIFGARHKPEGYIKSFAQDIEINYLTTRKHVEDEMNSVSKHCEYCR